MTWYVTCHDRYITRMSHTYSEYFKTALAFLHCACSLLLHVFLCLVMMLFLMLISIYDIVGVPPPSRMERRGGSDMPVRKAQH